MKIEVPRDENIGNKDITKKIELLLLDLFTNNSEEPFDEKYMLSIARQKFSSEYGWDLQAHVSWARDKLFCNNIIKRVAPGIYENVNGPDEIYTERETGHVKEGEYANRGYNTKGPQFKKSHISDWNSLKRKADVSAKILKECGWDKEKVFDVMIESGNFNPIATKLAVNELFDQIS